MSSNLPETDNIVKDSSYQLALKRIVTLERLLELEIDERGRDPERRATLEKQMAHCHLLRYLLQHLPNHAAMSYIASAIIGCESDDSLIKLSGFCADHFVGLCTYCYVYARSDSESG